MEPPLCLYLHFEAWRDKQKRRPASAERLFSIELCLLNGDGGAAGRRRVIGVAHVARLDRYGVAAASTAPAAASRNSYRQQRERHEARVSVSAAPLFRHPAPAEREDYDAQQGK